MWVNMRDQFAGPTASGDSFYGTSLLLSADIALGSFEDGEA